MSGDLQVLKAKDYDAGIDVRWCPGCGDYAILAQMKQVLAKLKASRENTVFVSGIGCSSRFPYYLSTFGFHTIHGRAPAFATGLKLANPELDVWLVTGDGDGLSIGGNHLIHALRRNIGVKIMLFNNRIYGLTKGQYSPTSLPGHQTKSTPYGSLDRPLTALSLAIGAEATFVARTVDVNVQHLRDTLEQAASHKGTAFIEIYQNCVVFNDGAWDHTTDKLVKDDNCLYLEHGKPMIFGKDRKKGVRLNGLTPEIVDLDGSVSEDDLLFHDAHSPDPMLAFLLSRLQYPAFPEPMGVLRQVEAPVYEEIVEAQTRDVFEKRGEGELDKLYRSADLWEVKA